MCGQEITVDVAAPLGPAGIGPGTRNQWAACTLPNFPEWVRFGRGFLGRPQDWLETRVEKEMT